MCAGTNAYRLIPRRTPCASPHPLGCPALLDSGRHHYLGFRDLVVLSTPGVAGRRHKHRNFTGMLHVGRRRGYPMRALATGRT